MTSMARSAVLLVVLSGYLGGARLEAQHVSVVEDTLRFGRFGLVHVYRGSERPSHVALFASGDGGWNLGVVTMARALSAHGALVAGFDVVSYLKALEESTESCSYPAGDFEALGHYLEQRYAFSTYDAPVLVGYSSGATLVYATAAQAPPNTFRGASCPASRPRCLIRSPACLL